MINNLILEEGKRYIYISLAVAVFSYIFICNTLALLALLVSIAFMFIYRNNHVIKAKTEKIVSPIDGKVLAIDFKNDKKIIYLKHSLCATHKVIAPITSKFKLKSLRNGLNLSGFSYKVKKLNSKKVFKFDDIKLELIDGRCNISHQFKKDSSNIEQYDKIGVFLEGTAIITLPKGTETNIKPGDKIKAGEVL